MTHFKSLLAACACTSIAGAASAQDLSFNWHNLHNSEVGYTFSYQAQFGLNAAAAGHCPGDGLGATNSVRLCYGIDEFQGGRNQSGSYEVTFARITQGAGLGTDVTFGDVTVSSAAIDDLSGDACTSPLFDHLQPGTVFRDSGTLIVPDGSTIPGTCGGNYDIYFDLSSTPATGPVVFNRGAPGTTLMANVILEIQMPTIQFIDDPGICGTPGFGEAQYFVASTTEYLADDPFLPGGIADGNFQMGSGLYGGTALSNNTLSPMRWTTTDGSSVVLTQAGMPAPVAPEEWQECVFGALATRTPALWVIRNDGGSMPNGIDGQGGADWDVSNGEVVVLRLIDQLAGSEGYFIAPPSVKIDAGLALIPSVDANPSLFINFPMFLWSNSPSSTLLQSPFTWDSNPFLLLGQKEAPGDFFIGPQATTRAGLQNIGVNAFLQDGSFGADPVFFFMLNNNILTMGSNFQRSWGPISDGTSTALVQNGYGTASYGMSMTETRATGNVPPGERFGVTAVGLQLSFPTFLLELTEFSSGVTIVTY